MTGGLKMIAGLGNPESNDRFVGTRHNMGFEVIDSLAKELQVEFGRKKRFGAVLARGRYGSQDVVLLKPWEYMNCSGRAVATAAGFFKVDSKDILVVSDELALEAGRVRLRARGSAGGHKGLQDIIDKLGTEEFARLRVGIGSNVERPAEDYVLSRPTAGERVLLDEAVQRAKKAVLHWMDNGVESAMNAYNPAPRNNKQKG